MHEFGARRDHIRIKLKFCANRCSLFCLGKLLCHLSSKFCQAFRVIFNVFGCSEATRSLLVHFSAWSHTIDCKVNQLLWPHQSDYFVCVPVNILKYFTFRLRLRVTIGRVRAGMNDSIHVEVQVVDRGIRCCYAICQRLLALLFCARTFAICTSTV